ncbi:hypothetical protein [Candidatus Venteria ishoeyi]|uniref:Uncharacterized protein n=1 Tax=Candidatus Venteria ishoeyi TaxID=1899563 RepID=A0A1H6FCP2_9GAMM|nr:hypothetical protein [Candidatus Venteria ishoeyi]SEH06804.1 Uncharacterised protein [Candidatus Venteria ishoeyi]
MQMFQHIKPKSPQAHYFHTKYFLPVVMQAFFQKLNTTSVSVLLCAPGSNSLLHDTLEDIKATWDSHDQMTLSYTPEDFKVDDSLLQRLIKTSKKVDVIFGMLSNTDTAIALFSQYKESLPLSKLFLIVDEAILEDLEKHPALLALVNSEHLITRKLAFSTAIDNGQFYTLINHYIAAFRATKFQYSERTHRHLPALYQCYRVQVKALMNPDCLFLMGFLKYLEADKKPVSLGFLRTHLELEHSDTLACRKRLLVTNFLKLKDEQISLTQFACEFLECISLDNIPRLSDVHQRFHARWKRHIEQTITTHFALREDVQSLHALGKIMYQAYAASGFLMRVRQWLSTKWYGSWLIDNDWLPAEQQAYWEHTLVKKHLFPIWQEYIGEWSKVGFPEQRDRARFLQTILDAYQVLRKKKNADISKRFDNLVFSLSMLRPNNVAHIYIGYSFKQRRQPDLIKDYFQMAVITGKYELLLNRYPPYHVMLNLHATPGTRTLFDSRGIDFTPMTIPLNFEYHCAVDLPKTQTRQQGRYLEIPSYIDKEKEALHQADIKKRKTDLANIFPAPDYISNIQFDLEHARILYTGEEKPIEIERYGQNRSKYIQDKSAFNLLSSLPPVPGNESGLVVRFKLREPLSALLDGLSMKRPFTLDEVCDVLKILDLYKAKRHQSDDKQACLDDIIRLVMTQAEIKNLSESTNEFLDEVNRIRQVDPTETSAWQYIIHQAADGKRPELLPALCNKLTNEGFDLVFSLMPALIGQELEVTPENLAQALEELEKTQNEKTDKKPPVVSLSQIF